MPVYYLAGGISLIQRGCRLLRLSLVLLMVVINPKPSQLNRLLIPTGELASLHSRPTSPDPTAPQFNPSIVTTSSTTMAEKSHCLYCFDVLASSYSKKTHLTLSEVESAYHDFETRRSSLTNGNSSGTNGVTTNGTSVNGHSSTNGVSHPERPLFVTWNLVKPGGKHLRGCIGTFEPQKLDDGLAAYALTS